MSGVMPKKTFDSELENLPAIIDTVATSDAVARVELPASIEEVHDAFASHPEVLMLGESAADFNLSPRARARKFALEPCPGGWMIHCASAGSGASAMGISASSYLVVKAKAHDEGVALELSFRLGRPSWAIARALSFIATSVIAVIWAGLALPGEALGRWILVSIFGLVMAPVVIRDMLGARQQSRHRRELLGLVEQIKLKIEEEHHDAERGPYRLRSGAAD
jgi:hypothetical protein